MKKSEILSAVIDYFGGDELSANVWIDKYALKDKSGELLEATPADMHKRLADEFARIEAKYPNALTSEEIFKLLDNFTWIIPQGSPMYGIGNSQTLTSLSNCFVIGSNNNADSYGSIMRTDEEQVQLMKRRGGVGHDLSHIRPSGALANNSVLGGLAGTILYMDRYSHSTREVAQDGRRGALMLSIDVRHPDTEKFIDVKLVQGKVTGANISVKLRDDFMAAVEANSSFIQRFPINLLDNISPNNPSYQFVEASAEVGKLYPIIENGEKVGYAKKIKAKDLWDKIIKNARESAEPGVFFWDKIISESPADCYGPNWATVTTNPCGEIPLCPYDSCRLLVLNLFSYVRNPFTIEASFDAALFEEHVKIAQRFMDDLVDLELEKIDAIIAKIKSDPEPDDIKRVEYNVWFKIREKAIEGRRTGLGITAEGDMLAALGLRYGSPEGNLFSINVHKGMAVASYMSSIELAKERGAFPMWNYLTEKENPFIKRVLAAAVELHGPKVYDDYQSYGRRNIATLTIAPTGTTSMMSQTTSGVEPLFLPWYIRRRKTDNKALATFIDEVGDMWEEYKVFHHKFVKWFEINHWNSDNFAPEYLESTTPKEWLASQSVSLLEEFFNKSPYYKATSNDVDWKASVELQGGIQQWVDHSISKTINLPEQTTVETVDALYLAAYHSGCKGVTVYRDGSRAGVLIAENKEKSEDTTDFKPIVATKRPKNVPCDIFYPTINKEKYIVLIGFLNGYPYEVFAYRVEDDNDIDEHIKHGVTRKRKSGWYDLYAEDGKTLLVENLSAQFETPEEEDRTRLISGWLRTGGDVKFVVDVLNKSKGSLTAFSKVIARQLKQYVKDGEKSSEKCPKCGDNLVFEEGCLHCNSCGYSKCG